MSHKYNENVAAHYASYRPRLHRLILKHILNENEKMDCGLDVGCGTGHSSIALAHFCNQVWGIDPSNEMLAKAPYHPAIKFQFYNKINFEFPDHFFDIITFAGSLFYGKSQELLDETIRVNKEKGMIMIYDFNVMLNEFYKLLNPEFYDTEVTDYDHSINFDGLYLHDLKILSSNIEQITFSATPNDLSHLLLSSFSHYENLVDQFGPDQLHQSVTEHLSRHFLSSEIEIKARIYYTVYQNNKT